MRLTDAHARMSLPLASADVAETPGEHLGQWEALIRRMARGEGGPEIIALKVEGRHVLLDPRTIDLVEACDKTIRVRAGGRVYLVRETMNSIAHRLDARRFLRVHRSTIVNIACIAEIQPWFQGAYVLILRDGERVVSGPAHRDAVRDLLTRFGPDTNAPSGALVSTGWSG
jgi:two-component system LytT family response regulator